MKGKKTLVTGAASGIGRAVARRYAAAGADVIAVDIDAEGLKELASEDLGRGEITPAVADVRSLADMESAVGDADLDVVAAVAGLTRVGSVDQMPLEDRDLVFDVNFFGVWNTIRAALPGMRRRGPGGRILVCGSIESVLGGEGLSAYVATKHAVLGLVKSLALELATSGITANLISPAGVDTELLRRVVPPERVEHIAATTPIPRLSSPEEVAAFFEFVAGPEAGYMTGENLIVDGGLKLVNAHTAGEAWTRS